MKKIITLFISILLCFFAYSSTLNNDDCCRGGRRCNPNGTCTACTTCSSCRHCSQNGGSCSVCRGSKSQPTYQYYNSGGNKKKSSYSTNNYSYNTTDYTYKSLVGSTQTVYKTINLRERPTTKSVVLAKIQADDEVKIISKTGSWYYVEYEYYDTSWSMYRTIKGYVYSSLINN